MTPAFTTRPLPRPGPLWGSTSAPDDRGRRLRRLRMTATGVETLRGASSRPTPRASLERSRRRAGRRAIVLGLPRNMDGVLRPRGRRRPGPSRAIWSARPRPAGRVLGRAAVDRRGRTDPAGGGFVAETSRRGDRHRGGGLHSARRAGSAGRAGSGNRRWIARLSRSRSGLGPKSKAPACASACCIPMAISVSAAGAPGAEIAAWSQLAPAERRRIMGRVARPPAATQPARRGRGAPPGGLTAPTRICGLCARFLP